MKRVHGAWIPSTLEEVLDPARCAVVVIDVQNDFCSPGGHFERGGKDVSLIQEMLPRLARFLDAARRRSVRVIHVQHLTLPDGAADSPAWLYLKTRLGGNPDYTLAGTWGQEFVAEAQPAPGEIVVSKHRSSAFHATGLPKILRAADVQTVVCVGVTTQGCVESTARDAGFYDYIAVVVEDCVATTTESLHRASLEAQCARVDVVTSDEVIAAWAAGAADALASTAEETEDSLARR